jgi:hypothetical protein
MPRPERRLTRGESGPAPAQVSTVMVALAYNILHCPDDALETGRVLAKIILEAAERGGPPVTR